MNLKNKAAIISWIERIALVLILYKAITLIIAGGEQFFESHIDRFVWEGIVYIGIAVLITYRPNLKNIWMYIFTFAFAAVLYYLLLRTDYKVNSPDLWEMYFRIGLAVTTLVPIFVDAICSKRFLRIKEHNPVKLCLFGLTCVLLLLTVDNLDGYLFLVFALIYMLTSFEQERVEMLVVCFAGADLVATTVLSVKSLITHPYAGDLRYIGAFTNLHDFGMFVGSGLVCYFFLALWGYKKFEKKYAVTLALAPFFIFLSVVFYLINSRNALLGIIVEVLAVGWLLSIVLNKSKLFKITIIAIVITGLLVSGLIVFLGLNYRKYKAFLDTFPQLHYLVWAYGRLDTPMLSKTGIFDDNSIWSHLDYFTNHRLSVWKVTIEQLKWFGGNSSLILVGNWDTNTHNTFLGYLNMMGIVVGGLLIACLFHAWGSSARAIRIHRNNPKEIGTLTIFIFLWYAYSLTIFLNEMLYMNCFYVIISLLLLGFLPRGERKIESDSN